jgi:hypothetical protein
MLQDFAETPPLLTWVEPRPVMPEKDKRGRIEDLPILQAGLPVIAHPLDEARLFWQDEAVHVVADDETGGCHWFQYGDKSWSDSDSVKKQSRSVMLREDLYKTARGWELIEYYQGAGLVAWRLAPGSDKSSGDQKAAHKPTVSPTVQEPVSAGDGPQGTEDSKVADSAVPPPPRFTQRLLSLIRKLLFLKP